MICGWGMGRIYPFVSRRGERREGGGGDCQGQPIEGYIRLEMAKLIMVSI